MKYDKDHCLSFVFEILLPRDMKKEKKYLKVIRAFGLLPFLLAVCMSFDSCITINQFPAHTMNPFIDPVCGVKVDTATNLKTEYNHNVYYFDSEECQKVFLKNPEKFVGSQASHYKAHNMSGMGWMGGAVMVTVMAIAMTTMAIFGHWR